MWIRINDIPMGDMPASQEQWVESQVGSGDQFVSIEDGDWSVVRAIGTEAHPLSYVLENHASEYIVCDKDSAEAAQLRAQGCEERKSYFSDQAVFTC
jgi:hypothetical protein